MRFWWHLSAAFVQELRGQLRQCMIRGGCSTGQSALETSQIIACMPSLEAMKCVVSCRAHERTSLSLCAIHSQAAKKPTEAQLEQFLIGAK
jgi:hypothetical protein